MNTKLCPTCKTPIPAHAPGGFCPACILRDADELPPIGRTAPSLAEVSAAFPQLEVLGLIGQGGMGFVYKVRQPSLDRIVALKILSPELSRDPAFAERFAREARVLGKLNHPNIVTVFESGVAQPFFYLIMEFVDGVNLRQAMRAGRFTPQQALAVVPGICDALQAAHAQGIWHRDIKPENILLDGQGGVKIVDFGIARLVGDPARDFTLTVTGAALGSAAYMAPEQHEKPHDVDHRADIYSLGVVIYEMLTGELPLGRFPAPSERAAVSARIDEIVFQTLEKERNRRQQSAEEVKTDVSNAANAPAPERAASTQPSQFRLVAKIALLAGLVLFATAAFFTHGSTQGTLLAISTTAAVLGGLGMLFSGKGTFTVVKGDAPAPITVRSLALFLGGLVAVGVGAAFYNGAELSAVTTNVNNIRIEMLGPERNTNVGHTLGASLMALGGIAAAIGWFGMWYALWQMRHGLIPTALRGVTRTFAYAPLAVILMGGIATGIYFAIGGPAATKQAVEYARKIADEQRAALVKEQQAKHALAGKVESPKASASPALEGTPPPAPKPPTPAAPAIPADSPEQVFRKLNALANESNGAEFLKLNVRSRQRNSDPAARWMEPLYGTPELVKVIETKKPVKSILFSAPAKTVLLAGLKKKDGSTKYLTFTFALEDNAWRLDDDGLPDYRAATRFEFRVEKGDALGILRTHIDRSVKVEPAPGAEGQFDLSVEENTASGAANRSRSYTIDLHDSLKKAGLDAGFKIIKEAEVPTKPMHAEDAEIEASKGPAKTSAPADNAKPVPAENVLIETKPMLIHFLPGNRIEVDGKAATPDELIARLKQPNDGKTKWRLEVKTEAGVEGRFIADALQKMKSVGAKFDEDVMAKLHESLK